MILKLLNDTIKETKMKVITLIEPWGSLIMHGKKTIETRSWKTNYRGELYIHTSKKRERRTDEKYLNAIELLNSEPIYGYIIAKCTLSDCIEITESFAKKIICFDSTNYHLGNYSAGRYAWILKDITPLEEFIPAIGKQGFWYYHKESSL
jgi:hypothetical protein